MKTTVTYRKKLGNTYLEVTVDRDEIYWSSGNLHMTTYEDDGSSVTEVVACDPPFTIKRPPMGDGVFA